MKQGMGLFFSALIGVLIIGIDANRSDAAVLLYGSTKDGDLFTVNLGSGAGTFVGDVQFETTEIEFDNSTGRAWLQLPDGSFQMSEFDITSATGIGGLISNNASFTGLEFVGSTLYGASIQASQGPSTLGTLDPVTGISTPIGLTDVGPIAGLAFDIQNQIMYGIAGGPGPADLYTLDLNTGAATVVGSTGIQAGSLEFGPDGNLYAGGTGNGGPDIGNIYRIDPVTGASALVGFTGFNDGITGLTLVVPTPHSALITLLMLPAAYTSIARNRFRF